MLTGNNIPCYSTLCLTGVYAQRPYLRSFSKKFKKRTYFVLLRTPFTPYTPIKTVTSVYGLRYFNLNMSKLKLRRSSKAYALRKRFLRLSSNEQVMLRHYKKVIQVLLVKTHLAKENSAEKHHYEQLLKVIMAKYYSAQIEPEYQLPPLKRLRTSIKEFSESECYIKFRFLKMIYIEYWHYCAYR